MDYYLLVLMLCTGVLLERMVRDTRGVCYFNANLSTDNEKMVRVAHQIRLGQWPSKMHDIKYSRGQLREYWVLGLVLVQKFVKDKTSDHVNIVLALWCNAGCVIVLYEVLKAWFTPEAAFAAALLYVTSIWPWQVAIYMGHIHLAQLLCLLSIGCVQWSGGGHWMYLFPAGVCAAMSFASSSASRKYIPLVAAAFLYTHRGLLKPWFLVQQNLLADSTLAVSLVLLAAGIGLAMWAVKLLKVQLGAALKAVVRKDWPADTYGDIALRLLQGGLKMTGLALAFAFVCVLSNDFYMACAVLAAGALAVAVHLLMPLDKILKNAHRYYVFLNIGVWANHFDKYPDQEKVFGRKLPKSFRGEGWPWVPRYLNRVIPHVQYLYAASVAGLFFLLPLAAWAGLVFVSLLPLLTVEFTKGLQVGKSYLPVFPGLLFLVAAFVDRTGASVGVLPVAVLWGGLTLLTAMQARWSWMTYVTDILPARMAATTLRNTLQRMGVKEFYTYDIPYNEPLVKTMVATYPGEFVVRPMTRLADVREGVVVIPGTSSKSVQMETVAYAIANGDFREDPDLERLYAGHAVEGIAAAKIPMLGCSKIYAHESEVSSYRDLILHQISDEDRWRAHAWVIRVENLREAGIGSR